MIAKLERLFLPGLGVVLAAYYVIGGVLIGGGVGLAGIAGGVLIAAAIMARSRSRPVAGALLMLGALPFAALLWWSVVVPILALVTLIIGGAIILRYPAPTALATS